MAELEVDLQLTIRDALEAIDDMGKALADMMEDFQDDISKAFKSFEEDVELSIDTRDAERNIEQLLDLVQPIELQVLADTETASETLEELRVSQMTEDLEITIAAETEGFNSTVAAARDSADDPLEVPIDINITEALESLDELRAEAEQAIVIDLEVGAETGGLAETTDSLEEMGSALDVGTEAAGAAHGALTEVTEITEVLGVVMEIAQGRTNGLTRAMTMLGVSAGGLGVLIGVSAAMGVLFHAAEQSHAATERLDLVFGDLAEDAARIDLGGLNGNLSDIAIAAGQSGSKLKEAAASAGQMAAQAGHSDQMVVFAQRINALAIRAAVLKPSLGEAGDVAEQLQRRLAMGGFSLEKYGISLTRTAISSRALADTGKDTVAELTQFEKAAAGAELATERLGKKLGEDVVEGSKQTAIQMKVLKAEMNSALSKAGESLIEPIIKLFKMLVPIVTTTAKVVGTTLGLAFEMVMIPIELVNDVVTEFIDILGLSEGSIDVVATALGVLLGVFVLYKAAMIANTVATAIMTAVQGGFTTAILSSMYAYEALMAVMGPVGWAMLAISAVAIGLFAIFGGGSDTIHETSQEAKDFAQAMIDADNDITNANVLKSLRKAFEDSNHDMAKAAVTISEVAFVTQGLSGDYKNLKSSLKNLSQDVTHGAGEWDRMTRAQRALFAESAKGKDAMAVLITAIQGGTRDIIPMVKQLGLADTAFGQMAIKAERSGEGLGKLTGNILDNAQALVESRQAKEDDNKTSDKAIGKAEAAEKQEKALSKATTELAKTFQLSFPSMKDSVSAFAETLETVLGTAPNTIQGFTEFLDNQYKATKTFVEGVMNLGKFPGLKGVILAAGEEIGTGYLAQIAAMSETEKATLNQRLIDIQGNTVQLKLIQFAAAQEIAKEFRREYNKNNKDNPMTKAEAAAATGTVALESQAGVAGAVSAEAFKKNLNITQHLNDQMDKVIKDFDVKRSELMTKVAQTASEVGKKFGEMLANAITGMRGVVSLSGTGLTQAAVNGAKTEVDAIRAVGRTAAQSFAGAMDNHRDVVRSAGQGLANAARDGAGEFTGYGVGSNAADGMVRGLRDGQAAVREAGKALGQSAKKGVQIGLELRSPSRVMRKLGQQSGAGFALGLEDMNERVASAALSLANAAVVPTAYQISASVASSQSQGSANTSANNNESQAGQQSAPVIGSMTVIGQDPISTAAAVGRELAFQRRFQGGT
jgi:hypothetical protein